MKKTIRVTAKKAPDAIRQGLEILGATIDEVEVTIISAGGLFKKAEVELSIGTDDGPQSESGKKDAVEVPQFKLVENKPTPPTALEKEKPLKADEDKKPRPQKVSYKAEKPEKSKDSERESSRPRRMSRPSVDADAETVKKAEEFLSKTLVLAGIEAELKSETTGGLTITIETEDSAVIGHHGETLDAFQYLTSLVVNEGSKEYVAVTLDAFGYRARRAEILKRMASKMAEKCLKSGRRVALEPMNNNDRKEIHAYLSEIEGVVTKSEGNEPHRRIIIYPRRTNE